jgi:3D (Asp-Asp-Asp) domain-containing protein
MTSLLLLLLAYAPEWRTVEASAYCPCAICCGEHADGKTATGRDASLPGVAVDPAVIPLGSRLDVPGVGSWRLADDTGGAIKGEKIDVRMSNHEEAKKFGRRTLRVRVWRKTR